MAVEKQVKLFDLDELQDTDLIKIDGEIITKAKLLSKLKGERKQQYGKDGYALRRLLAIVKEGDRRQAKKVASTLKELLERNPDWTKKPSVQELQKWLGGSK